MALQFSYGPLLSRSSSPKCTQFPTLVSLHETPLDSGNAQMRYAIQATHAFSSGNKTTRTHSTVATARHRPNKRDRTQDTDRVEQTGTTYSSSRDDSVRQYKGGRVPLSTPGERIGTGRALRAVIQPPGEGPAAWLAPVLDSAASTRGQRGAEELRREHLESLARRVTPSERSERRNTLDSGGRRSGRFSSKGRRKRGKRVRTTALAGGCKLLHVSQACQQRVARRACG